MNRGAPDSDVSDDTEWHGMGVCSSFSHLHYHPDVFTLLFHLSIQVFPPLLLFQVTLALFSNQNTSAVLLVFL